MIPVGIDEVGRGCLAGPVYAAAVVIDETRINALASDERALIRDSKKLSRGQRERAIAVIDAIAREQGVGRASVPEIEELGIVAATFRAMERALSVITGPYDVVLVDGRYPLPNCRAPQRAVVRGDDRYACIAAASIIAKVARDRFMAEQAERYQHWGFAENVGYGTAAHQQALAEHGICPLHRRNFAPISAIAQKSLGDGVHP